jgi:predicted amidohydrolase YtcJ
MDALKALTIWAAYQHFEESIKGSLEVGKQADFVVLDADPLTVEATNIKNMKVLKTVNNDKTVFTHGD